jgi:hypothetical protein
MPYFLILVLGVLMSSLFSTLVVKSQAIRSMNTTVFITSVFLVPILVLTALAISAYITYIFQ